LIIESLYADASDVPNEGKAIIAGGLAGAGKTTVLGEHAGIDQSQYFKINPDTIKEELAKHGLIPDVPGLSPMETSDLVHRESSYVARQLALRAQADGKNLIWDITMSSRDSVKERVTALREAGYQQIDGIFVDIPIDVSVRRAEFRHRAGEDDYRAGVGFGGRYVPPEVTAAQADEQWGSKNRKTFEELKPIFNRWTRFDNGVDDRDPVLVDAGQHEDNHKEAP
jgi:predicted kinase